MSIFDGLLGSLVGGASSLIGGIVNRKAASDAYLNQVDMANHEWEHTQEVAKHSAQWRAADVTEAERVSGINRLALLGAPTVSVPSSVVGGGGADTSMGNAIASGGQEIGRALNAYASRHDRQADLQNKLIEAQIANVNSDTVRNQMAASKMVTQAPTAPTPLYQTFVDDKGRKYRLPSQGASTAMQNWASLPAQIPIAVTQLGDAIQSEYNILKEPIKAWMGSHGWSGSRGDAGRYVDYYGVP